MADFTIADVTDAMLDGMRLAEQLVSVPLQVHAPFRLHRWLS